MAWKEAAATRINRARCKPSSRISVDNLAQKDFPANVNGMIYDFLGGMPKEKGEAFKAASPVTYIDKDNAPICTIKERRTCSSPLQSGLSSDRCHDEGRLGRRIELLIAQSWLGRREMARTMAGTMAFFDEQLRK